MLITRAARVKKFFGVPRAMQTLLCEEACPSDRLIIGLTGSIGMGKSTVAAMFEDLGAPVFVRMPRFASFRDRAARFSRRSKRLSGTTGPGEVDRDALGTLAFGDAEKLAQLELLVILRWPQSADFAEAHADAKVVVFDIPAVRRRLRTVDHVVVVSAPTELSGRACWRPGMTTGSARS